MSYTKALKEIRSTLKAQPEMDYSMNNKELCKNCGGEHALEKCMKGKSYNDMKKMELEKSKADKGFSENQKQQARAHRSFSHNVGVHKPHSSETPGMSTMGANVRAAKRSGSSLNQKFHTDAAKRAVSYVSSDSKRIQPDLPKSELKSGMSYNQLRNQELEKSQRSAKAQGSSALDKAKKIIRKS